MSSAARSGNYVGLFVVLGKIGPKLTSIMAKFLKVIPKLFKGVVGIKTAGAAASLGLYTLVFSWQMGVSLVIFLLVHEYGHLWAMKRCGIKIKGIYLIPGLGAAAISEEYWKSAGNEVYIAIMGPLVGLLFIVPMLVLYEFTLNPIFAAIVSIMAFINLFNLFPLNSLDGGRITKGILYSFHGSIAFIFTFVSFLAAIGLSCYFGFSLLVFVGLAGLLEAINSYGLEKTLVRFMRSLLRLASLFFLILFCYSALQRFDNGSMWPAFLFVCLSLLAFFFFAWDIQRSSESLGVTRRYYPVLFVVEIGLGLKELLSLRREDLMQAEEYEPMDKSRIALSSFGYLFVIALMVGLIWYSSSVPGCELGLELLK